MIVYNEEKTQILDSYDLTKGYLENSTRTVTLPAVEAVEEISHLNVIRTYPNGGRDEEIVIDSPGVEAQPERTVEEPCTIYKPFTAEDLLQIELGEINNWFQEYDNQTKQYERSVRLNIPFDRDMLALDEEAQKKAARKTEILHQLDVLE